MVPAVAHIAYVYRIVPVSVVESHVCVYFVPTSAMRTQRYECRRRGFPLHCHEKQGALSFLSLPLDKERQAGGGTHMMLQHER